ncbi:ABC transporter substrate-binding protein [Paraglaciecola aquimarina]|uniref:ABC transporter substrate-binding protein n=1 Tax=Paraglaciecola aquimarina TaxID=1235557 RepID=A0ABU3SS33_9ALTE|nr:ABC transporter substrate-binding protein [Paraglaciecola aquimarina]MDU0352835.1 ABC transporter substrate-binding protein [Paraglaciecola aquimarina]
MYRMLLPKNGRCTVTVILLLASILFSQFSRAQPEKTTLTVAILIFSTDQRNAFENIASLFNKKYPHIEIRYISSDDANFKENYSLWDKNSKYIDVLNWPWAARLTDYANLGWLEPVTDLWQHTNVGSHYSKDMKSLVSVDQDQYAIPYATGFWGFYYKESVFKKFAIDIPTTWHTFLASCRTLRAQKVIPIAIGTKQPWPAAGWFDYLNIRINGLKFHMQLLQGHLSFNRAEIREVFAYWKELLDNQCFIRNSNSFTFKHIIPLLYRDLAGMILAGNFITTQISPAMRDDIKFFRFPTIKPHVAVAEEAPTDMFVIPASSNNKAEAKQFLYFLSQPQAQEILSEMAHFIPTNQATKTKPHYFLYKGQHILKQAVGFSQYLDRDTTKAFSDKAMRILAKFIESGNISETIDALEKSRLQTFSQTEPPPAN